MKTNPLPFLLGAIITNEERRIIEDLNGHNGMPGPQVLLRVRRSNGAPCWIVTDTSDTRTQPPDRGIPHGIVRELYLLGALQVDPYNPNRLQLVDALR